MALSYNTESYVNIAEDLKKQVDSGKLSQDQIDPYLRQKYEVTADEYYDATDQALEAEKKYFEMKKKLEDSPTSFLGMGSSYIPAHLREQEESTFQSILNFPARAIQSGVRSIGTGVADLGEMVLPEAVTKPIAEVAGDVDDALSGNKVYEALKTTFDPATTKAEEVVGELGTLFAGGAGLTKLVGKAAPALKARKLTTLGGSIPSIAGFTAADIIITDKNQNIANTIINVWPESTEYLEKLAINPDDADSMKLLKKGLEGVGFGMLAEGVFVAAAAALKPLKTKLTKWSAERERAIQEDDILTPPVDDSGKIKNVEVVERPDGSHKQKVTVSQPIKIIGGKKAKESKGVTGFLKRWLTSRQGLDKKSFEAMEKLDNTLKAETKYAEQQGKEFISVLEREYKTSIDKIPKEELELINNALGRVPALGEDASEEVLKILRKKPSERTRKPKPPKPLKEGAKPRKEPKKPKKPPKISDEEVLDNYTAQVLAAARQRQGDALAKLPENVAKETERLRLIVDTNSEEIVKRGLGDSGKTSAAIDNKVGLYLTTDYEIFTNPQWLKRIKAAKADGQIDDKEALDVVQGVRNYVKKNNKKLSEADIDESVNGIIKRFDGSEEDFFKVLTGEGETAGGHYLGKIIKGRKYIPSDIRKLLKEVENPTNRVMATIDKQGKLIAEHQFLREIREIAVSDYGSNLFRTGSKFKGKEGIAKEAGKDSEIFGGDLEDIANNYIKTLGPNANPLLGVFTTPSFKKKLSETLDVKSPTNKFLKGLHGMQVWASGAQTVLSEATHLVNVSGNVIMSLANGNIMPWRGGIKEMLTYSPDLNRLLNKVGGKFKINIEEYKDLQQRGLVSSGVNQEFFVRSLDDAGFEKLLNNSNKAVRYPSKIVDGLASIYRAEDDTFKVFNYYQELSKARKAFPNMPEEQLKELATDTVKEILPIYSRVPRALKGSRIVPVVGAFPSFLVESFRVGKNTSILGAKEFLTGVFTRNAGLAQNGAERMAGTLAVGALGSGYLISGNEANGISKVDNEVIDKLSPIYDRNSVRSFNKPFMLNHKTGNIETNFFNVSRNIPYDAMLKFSKAIFQYANSGKLTDANQIEDTVQKIGQVFDPLITESLAIEPILNLLSKTKGGRAIYPEDATVMDIFKVALGELGPRFFPKTIIDIMNYQKSVDSRREKTKDEKGFPNLTSEEKDYFGVATKSGYPARVADRIKRFYGLTQQTFDFNQSLQSTVNKEAFAIRNIDGEMKNFLRTFQDRTQDLSKQETVDKIINEVDAFVEKSFNAQKKLAEILDTAKDLTYFNNRIKDDKGNMIRQTIDDSKLKAILSKKGFLEGKEIVDTALVYLNQQRGRFVPPLLGKDKIQKFEGMNKIRKELLLMIENRLIQYRRQTVPLIPKESKE